MVPVYYAGIPKQKASIPIQDLSCNVAIARSRRTEAFAFARAVKIGSQELSVNILRLQAA
jgi:hypothetical protein